MNLIHKRNLQEKEILQLYKSITTVQFKLNDCVLGNTFSPHLNVFNLRNSINESCFYRIYLSDETPRFRNNHFRILT